MSATRMPYPSAQPVYAAAAEWRDRCLLDDQSLFSGDHSSTLAHGEELIRDFVERPDVGSGDFFSKISGQLANSSPGAVQLAAELLYIYLLPARSESVSGSAKRDLIDRVLSLASGTHPMPEQLATVLDAGIVRMGTAYGTYRWKLFTLLIETFVALKRLPLSERRRVLTADPDAFVTLLDQLDDSHGGVIQKYALEHLLYPDDFSPAFSSEARQSILRRWSDLAGPTNLPESKRLTSVHRALANELGQPNRFIEFWWAPWHWEWAKVDRRWETAAKWFHWWEGRVDLDAEERDFKVKVAQRLAALAPEPDPIPRLRAILLNAGLLFFIPADTFLTWAESDPSRARQLLSDLWADPSSDALTRFQERLPPDLLPQRGARLGISSVLHMAAGVEQLPPWRAAYIEQFTKTVSAFRPEPSATDGEVYDYYLALLDAVLDLAQRRGISLRDRLDAQGIVYVATKWPADDPGIEASTAEAAAIEAWRKGKGAEPPDPPKPSGNGETLEPTPLADLAARIFLDVTFVETIDTLLRDRRQLIFTGNPGTGKTFVAREFASWFAGDPDRVRLVQFHPAYSYEDFVEGYRPTPGGAFVLRPGPLRSIAEDAAAHPADNYVLIVDELNRGNVARVFGELYFLLEYRDEAARLMYSDEPFTLPPNLYLIGTMNSADRSIALLDSALRRRFSFVDFDSREGAVAEVLDRFLVKHVPEMQWVAELVLRANKTIDDPLAAIGPSYFLRKDLNPGIVARIWEHDILPTLKEHLYGQDEVLARLTYEALAAQSASAEQLDDDSVAG